MILRVFRVLLLLKVINLMVQKLTYDFYVGKPACFYFDSKRFNSVPVKAMVGNKTLYLFENSQQTFKYFIKHKSTSPPSNFTSLDYCLDLVKKLDHENYLCSLLLPEKLRSTAFAIRAFNIELSKIQEQASEFHAGVMRVKFWEDSLDKIYDDKPLNHPVIIELHKATKRHKLSKLLLKRLITSRSKQLNVSTFNNMKEMENYADQTCSPVLMLLLEAFNVRNVDCDHVASHIGRAQGLSNLIRGLPHNLKEKLVLLPRSELIKHEISEESLIRNTVNPDKLSQIIFEIATVANNHLKVANSLKEKIPVECKSLFLPAVPIRIFLEKLEKCNFFIYEPRLFVKNGLLPLVLYWSKLRKSY